MFVGEARSYPRVEHLYDLEKLPEKLGLAPALPANVRAGDKHSC